MDTHQVTRYDVAALIFRFWWVVAALGLLAGALLLRSIATALGQL